MGSKRATVFCSSSLNRIRKVTGDLQLRKLDRHVVDAEKRNSEEYLKRAKRKAAVCIPLCNVENEASVLFTLRSDKVGTHAGQVSFPGGHVEPEETAETAALRELYEETGLEGQILGPYHMFRAVTGTMVAPFLVWIPKELSKGDVEKAAVTMEVESTFSVKVSDLLNERNRTVEHLRGFDLPRFEIDGQDHPPIWGLTAAMLDGVLRDVLG